MIKMINSKDGGFKASGPGGNLITSFKRFGRFQMNAALIDQRPDELKQLFGKMIVTRAEILAHSGQIEYIAICDDFDYIKLGDPIPGYKWKYSTSHGWKCEKDPEFNRDYLGGPLADDVAGLTRQYQKLAKHIHKKFVDATGGKMTFVDSFQAIDHMAEYYENVNPATNPTEGGKSEKSK